MLYKFNFQGGVLETKFFMLVKQLMNSDPGLAIILNGTCVFYCQLFWMLSEVYTIKSKGCSY